MYKFAGEAWALRPIFHTSISYTPFNGYLALDITAFTFAQMTSL